MLLLDRGLEETLMKRLQLTLVLLRPDKSVLQFRSSEQQVRRRSLAILTCCVEPQLSEFAEPRFVVLNHGNDKTVMGKFHHTVCGRRRRLVITNEIFVF